jgi:hypothetical protein
VSTRLALYLLETGDTEGALGWLSRASAVAERVGDDLLSISATHRAARARLQRGELAQAEALLEAARARADKNPVANRLERVEMRVTAAELALARGEAASAAQQFEVLLRDLGFPATHRAQGLVPALLGASSSALALGDVQTAALRASQALSAARALALDPGRSGAVGDAWLALARAQRAGGELARARESAEQAANALRAGRGPDHPGAREALALSQTMS